MGAFSFPSGRGLFSAPTSLILASVAAAGVSFLLVFSPIVPKIKKYLKRLTLLRQLETAKFVKIGHVSALNVYPIKSAKGEVIVCITIYNYCYVMKYKSSVIKCGSFKYCAVAPTKLSEFKPDVGRLPILGLSSNVSLFSLRDPFALSALRSVWGQSVCRLLAPRSWMARHIWRNKSIRHHETGTLARSYRVFG